MATPTSSVPRAKGALMRLFDADPTLVTVKHDWAPPPADRIQHEHIWFGDLRDMDRETKIANRVRRESYTLPVVVSVARGGYDGEGIETRAWDIVAALELALIADPQLDAYDNGVEIGQPFQALIGPPAQRSFPALEGGWATEITLAVECTAHLRVD
jgi:hypothetical protein